MEFFADVTLRECLAATLGLSFGLLLLVVGSIIADAIGRRRAAHGTSADCYDEAFSSDDHYIGHRDRFRA
mgnify:CR=1 FL=1|jgi:hypothetical protein